MRNYRLQLCTGLLLVAMCSTSFAGKIVVSNDEWPLSNTGFTDAPQSTTIYARNVTSWFANGATAARFLIYSDNFDLDPSHATDLATVEEMGGYQWISYHSVPGFTFDLKTLLHFTGVFLACSPVADNDVLIKYVTAGGSVYLAGGTGNCGSQGEANAWNTFLNAFGLSLQGTGYNGINGIIPIANRFNHPVLRDVTSLYQDNGSSILYFGGKPGALIIDYYQGQGLYAVYESQ